MNFSIEAGDVREVLQKHFANSFDACLTDPPYGLSKARPTGRSKATEGAVMRGFMGMEWDGSVPSKEVWAEVLRVLKPGAMLLAFGGTRTYHRLACAIEDAGFEIRDCCMWLYGSGFPKSLDISKGIDKRGGVSISWFGPWLRQERARRGISSNDLGAHFPSKTSGGPTGCVRNWELGLNLPTVEQFNTLCRVLDLPFQNLQEAEREVLETRHDSGNRTVTILGGKERDFDVTAPATGAAKTWDGYGTALKPAWEPIIVAMKPLDGTYADNALKHGVAGLNVDGSRIGTSKNVPASASGVTGLYENGHKKLTERSGMDPNIGRWPANLLLDEEAAAALGEPSRFFYVAKASTKERGAGNNHPTVKPLKLVEYLAKLILPPNPEARLLVPFSGSGSEMLGARAAGWQNCTGIEISEEYRAIAEGRLAA